MCYFLIVLTNSHIRLLQQQNGNVIWRRESARKGISSTSGAQFVAQPLVKPVVWFARAVVHWRSRPVAKSAYYNDGDETMVYTILSLLLNTFTSVNREICTTWLFFFLFMSFTVHYFYTKISIFTSFLSIRNALDCFYLLIFFYYFFCEILKLNLSCSIIITLNPSEVRTYLFTMKCSLSLLLKCLFHGSWRNNWMVLNSSLWAALKHLS